MMHVPVNELLALYSRLLFMRRSLSFAVVDFQLWASFRIRLQYGKGVFA
jgi:hypothetical protein